MRLDKRTYVLVGVTIIVTMALGYWAGAWFGVLAAFAGLVPAALLEATKDNRNEAAAREKLLAQAGRDFAPRQILEGGVAKYLRPEEAVVEFWPREELTVLRQWLISDRPADIRLVTGEGGTGKTRLALQLADEATREYGHRTYWIAPGDEAQAVTAIEAGETPALAIVDYAETREHLTGLLSRLSHDWTGPNARVLLLARSAGEWWDQLIASTDAQLSEILAATPVITLGSLSPPSAQGEVFRQALQAFATELEMNCPSAELPPVDADAIALVIHAAALLTVLNHNHAGIPVNFGSDRASVIDGLLRHEARYWEHSQTTRGLNLGPVVTRRAVVAGTLAGADDEASAAGLLAAIPDLSANPGLRGKIARWLHDLYPVATPGTAPDEWIGPLRPDLLAEHLAVNVLAGQKKLLPALLRKLPEHRIRAALTVLARAALTETAATNLMRTAITSDPVKMVVPAMAVAVETNRSVGDLIAGVLASMHMPSELASRIAAALPSNSVALAGTAEIAYERLTDSSASDTDRAGNLLARSTWLSRLGRREEALDAITGAVTAYRSLAAARPDAFPRDLAGSLNNQSTYLADLGRREEALDAISQAVTIHRDLAAARPDAFPRDLPGSLSNQSGRLADLGRWEEALVAITEAVTAYRSLAAARPDAFLPDLAMALSNQSNRLSDLGRWEEALDAITGAVTAYRSLAAARPDAFLPFLATVLNNQSSCLADLDRLEDALDAVTQAVTIQRDLAAARPDVFLPDLALSLTNQSEYLADLDYLEDALDAITQAVTIQRDLVSTLPSVFGSDFRSSLMVKANLLESMGRQSEAEKARAEAEKYQ